jgi:hypothetical protein
MAFIKSKNKSLKIKRKFPVKTNIVVCTFMNGEDMKREALKIKKIFPSLNVKADPSIVTV